MGRSPHSVSQNIHPPTPLLIISTPQPISFRLRFPPCKQDNYGIYSNTPQDNHDRKHSRKAGRLCRPPLVMLSISVKSSQQKVHIDYTALGSSVMILSCLSKSRNQNSPPRIIYSRAHVRSARGILGAAPESTPPLKDGASAAASLSLVMVFWYALSTTRLKCCGVGLID